MSESTNHETRCPDHEWVDAGGGMQICGLCEAMRERVPAPSQTEGKGDCPDCHGKGWRLYRWHKCGTCYGTGQIAPSQTDQVGDRVAAILGMILNDAEEVGGDRWRLLIAGQLKQEAEEALELRHGKKGGQTARTDGEDQ